MAMVVGENYKVWPMFACQMKQFVLPKSIGIKRMELENATLR
jgi:hypothetical protein